MGGCGFMLSLSRYISCTTSQNSHFNCRISAFPYASVSREQIWLKANLHMGKLKKNPTKQTTNFSARSVCLAEPTHWKDGSTRLRAERESPFWPPYRLRSAYAPCAIALWVGMNMPMQKHTGNLGHRKQLATCQHIIIVDKSHCWHLGLVFLCVLGFFLRLLALYSTRTLG